MHPFHPCKKCLVRASCNYICYKYSSYLVIIGTVCQVIIGIMALILTLSLIFIFFKTSLSIGFVVLLTVYLISGIIAHLCYDDITFIYDFHDLCMSTILVPLLAMIVIVNTVEEKLR
jgi:hypothetical protein